jgi:Protein of unknown function (DUF4236)
MGFRFRRSIKLLPGIRLNIGKRGVSTSIGVRGVHVTFGKTGTRTTVGLPGSGISYTHLDKPRHERAVTASRRSHFRFPFSLQRVGSGTGSAPQLS